MAEGSDGALSESLLIAAAFLQQQQDDQGARRPSSATSSVGSEYYASPGHSHHGAAAPSAAARHSAGPVFDARSQARHGPGSLSPDGRLQAPGTASAPVSPTKRSPLGGGQRGAPAFQPTVAGGTSGGGGEGLPGQLYAPPPQHRLTSGAAGVGLESLDGSEASRHNLSSLPSFAFAAPGAAAGRRATAGVPSSTRFATPRPSNIAAGLAAAAAAQQLLAAEEQQRREAAAAADELGAERAFAAPARLSRLHAVAFAAGHGGKPAADLAGAEDAGVNAPGTYAAAAAALREQQEKEEAAEGAAKGDFGGLNPEHSSGNCTSDDLGLEEIAAERCPAWYRRPAFWGRALSLTLSLGFFVAGIVTLVVCPDAKLANFAVWRWCFFLGCWPIIYWTSVWALWGLTRICEWRMFSARTAIYFLVGTRGALMLVIRSSLVLATFAALFQTQPDKDSAAVQRVFKIILKILGCVVLCTVANLVKKILIKLMSTHHHREVHFERMQAALRKEYFLSVLSQPREPQEGTLSQEASGQLGAGPRPRSFAKRWLSKLGSTGALHSLPTMALRSLSRGWRHGPGDLGEDVLLPEDSQLSTDGQLSRPADQPEGHMTLGVGSSPNDDCGAEAAAAAAVEKSNRSATAALTSISVVVGAGVEPSSKSMPNLARQMGNRFSLAAAGDGEQQQQHKPRFRGSLGLPPAMAGGADGGKAGMLQQSRGSTAAGELSRQQSGLQLPLGAAGIRLGPSPLSRQASLLSAHTVRSGGAGAKVPSRVASLASRQSIFSAGASPAPPPLAALLDLEDEQPAQQAQRRPKRARRTSIVQMPPEELEKMKHIEKHIRKNKLKVGFVDQLGHMKHVQGPEAGASNEQEARRVAFFVYHNLRASRKRTWIQQSDLEDFLPPTQAEEAFQYLDIDGNGRISQSEVRESVLKIYQERAFLASTLRDTKSVIAKLERVLGGILHTLCCFFYLYIFGINVTQAWVTFSSIMLAFTFIFGNSIRNIFECCVWLFVVHPYDVGDTLVMTGENYRVDEIALLNTVLVRWDGARIYCPNSRLAVDQLTNLSRSAKKAEALKLSLDMGTPLEVIDMLRSAVDEHVKANASEFTGSSVNVKGLGDPMKLAVSIWFEFTHNGVDAGRCSRARTGLYMVVAAALNGAQVKYSLPPFAGDPAAVKANAALEAQPELAAAVGLPAYPVGPS